MDSYDVELIKYFHQKDFMQFSVLPFECKKSCPSSYKAYAKNLLSGINSIKRIMDKGDANSTSLMLYKSHIMVSGLELYEIFLFMTRVLVCDLGIEGFLTPQSSSHSTPYTIEGSKVLTTYKSRCADRMKDTIVYMNSFKTRRNSVAHISSLNLSNLGKVHTEFCNFILRTNDNGELILNDLFNSFCNEITFKRDDYFENCAWYCSKVYLSLMESKKYDTTPMEFSYKDMEKFDLKKMTPREKTAIGRLTGVNVFSA